MSRRRLIGVLVACLLSGCVAADRPPLLRSPAGIRAFLLRETPAGSSLASVKADCERRHWIIDMNKSILVDGAAGYSFNALIGGYQGWLWRVNVLVRWDFDEARRLVDIRVMKIQDAL